MANAQNYHGESGKRKRLRRQLQRQVDGVGVDKGEVLVNVNRAGQIISFGNDNYPQINVTNSFAISPAQAVTAAAAGLGVSGFTPGACSTQEKATRSNNIYVGFLYADDSNTAVDESNRPGVARSTDKGVTWSTPLDLSTISDVKQRGCIRYRANQVAIRSGRDGL